MLFVDIVALKKFKNLNFNIKSQLSYDKFFFTSQKIRTKRILLSGARAVLAYGILRMSVLERKKNKQYWKLCN